MYQVQCQLLDLLGLMVGNVLDQHLIVKEKKFMLLFSCKLTIIGTFPSCFLHLFYLMYFSFEENDLSFSAAVWERKFKGRHNMRAERQAGNTGTAKASYCHPHVWVFVL